MLISPSTTCIHNFSNCHALFVFFLTTFCSCCSMEWDTTFRPKDDPFWVFFLSTSAQQPEASSNPKQYLFSLHSWKKYLFGHSSRKDNHPGPLPQQGVCNSLQIWDELGVTWQTKQRAFFAISGASNFKQRFMTLSGLGLLTMWELPQRVSYFVSSLL